MGVSMQADSRLQFMRAAKQRNALICITLGSGLVQAKIFENSVLEAAPNNSYIQRAAAARGLVKAWNRRNQLFSGLLAC